ncbi:MAG: DUF6323 family protein [Clostridiales bacterium]|nr:DUF6323 family protein [Clostridiales bacterium]
MGFELKIFDPILMQQQRTINEIVLYNEISSTHGLTLTSAEALELFETRSEALKDTELIELGSGVIGKIIQEFCDSPYISKADYANTLNSLVEMFYFYKSDVENLISDDKLISHMKAAFNGVCQGSLELLGETEMLRFTKNIRFGYDEDLWAEEDVDDDEDEYEQY